MSAFARVIRLTMFATVVALAACSAGDRSTELWGEDAVKFFDELAAAYSTNDYYGVLDFYEVDAFQERRRTSIGDGLLIRELLLWNSGDLGHDVLSSYLGERGAVNLVRWEVGGGLSTVLSTVDGGRVVAESVFDHAAWAEGGLLAHPDTVAHYEAMYANYATTSGLEPIVLSQTVNATPLEGPAVFLGPADFGEDPMRAIGIYGATDDTDCRLQVAVVWSLDDAGHLDEETYLQAESQGGCPQPDRVEGWWEGLEIPEPIDQMVTNYFTTASGRQVEIANGTQAIESLLADGLERFSMAGLATPDFDRVTFEPTRKCENRSGRLIQDEDSRQLFICLFASDVCASASVCEDPRLRVQALILHELAHAWIIDHVDGETRARLLAEGGLLVWDDESSPWNRRGVEYAAEVIAWGLLKEPIPMVRIGSPSCASLAASYVILTGVEPPVDRLGC